MIRFPRSLSSFIVLYIRIDRRRKKNLNDLWPYPSNIVIFISSKKNQKWICGAKKKKNTKKIRGGSQNETALNSDSVLLIIVWLPAHKNIILWLVLTISITKSIFHTTKTKEGVTTPTPQYRLDLITKINVQVYWNQVEFILGYPFYIP